MLKDIEKNGVSTAYSNIACASGAVIQTPMAIPTSAQLQLSFRVPKQLLPRIFVLASGCGQLDREWIDRTASYFGSANGEWRSRRFDPETFSYEKCTRSSFVRCIAPDCRNSKESASVRTRLRASTRRAI